MNKTFKHYLKPTGEIDIAKLVNDTVKGEISQKEYQYITNYIKVRNAAAVKQMMDDFNQHRMTKFF